MRTALRRWLRVSLALALAGAAAPGQGEEKLVLLDNLPRALTFFEVAADGSRLYFGSASTYYVLDARGKLVDKFGLSGGAARELVPLPNGWFIAFNSHASGHIALFRPDGTEVRKLVTRGGGEKHLRHDMTGWTSPTGGAVDAGRKLIFALDTSMAQRGIPDPWWSRIAVFDLDGKYLRDIRRYDHKAKDKDDGLRTWYDDIEIDPARQRVYATARRTRELLAFGYDGTPMGKAAGQGGIAVLPDGRVAVGARDGRSIQLLDAELKPIRRIPLLGLRDLEADAAGRLYASVHDPSTAFVRWSADLKASETFGPRYRRIRVAFPEQAAVAGEPLAFKAYVEGRPQPPRPYAWQVMVRPSDGSDLRWRRLQADYYDNAVLLARAPPDLCGLYEVAVRFGTGPIPLSDRKADLSVQKTFAFRLEGAERSVAIITATGRRAFRQGETIPLHVIRRDHEPGLPKVKVELLGSGKSLLSSEIAVASNHACAIWGGVTARLAPGRYILRPTAAGHESYPLAIDVAPREPDSPMQRILYHEFDNEAVTMRQNHLADAAERMAFIRDYAEAAARLGFTRETDRLVGKLDAKHGPGAWRRDHSPVPLNHPAYAPAEHYAVPPWNANWEAEYYLDQATRWGIRYDSQLLGHCSGVRFRDAWLAELVPILQRTAQWLDRYPSFYGFNYNDEMFFGQWVTDWKQADKDWLKRMHETEFKGRPMADVYMAALRKMYGAFNKGVRQASGRAKLTATPMWQFPAVEGSYPPVIYEDMSESYSHYLSEGYHYPWYPAHSVDALRRPGKPLMGVFDNSYSGQGGDCFLQDLMQVLARGVQGCGVQHTRPFKDARGASAYRTGNLLAKLYGSIFAECPPANEAAILYSYAQDVAERRNSMGTPHWERVFTLHSAGLMAGVPMGITFEEDIAAGWLLADRKPRVPMLFLVGQPKPLPPKVEAAVRAFVAKGGKVFADADSADFPWATKLPLKAHVLKSEFHEGYAADTIYPLFQPVLEKLAADLRAAVGKHRRFPAETDTPWVSVSQFDGGAVRYLMLATDEGTPYPWDAGTVWSLGALWRFSVLPKTATLSFPATKSVLYDLFDQCLVQPKIEGTTAKLRVDLRTFPGRLYALAPARLGAPQIAMEARETWFSYRITLVDDGGRPVAARVPLRIRLVAEGSAASERYCGTRSDGTYSGFMSLPINARLWRFEVTELLGGRGSTVKLASYPPADPLLAARAEVEMRRSSRIQSLLDEARRTGHATLVAASDDVLTEEQRAALTDALREKGIRLKYQSSVPKDATPGVWLAAGHLPGQATMGDLLWQAWHRGLLPLAVSAHVPGPGRGLVTACFAPRGAGEHCIAIVGGDRAGLAKAVDRLIQWLGRGRKIYSGRRHKYAPVGKPGQVAPVPRLTELVGVRLNGVRVAADGKHLVVTAKGYLRNVALIEDQGERARVVRAVRIGQAPTVGSPALSADGRLFGAAARVTARFGQGLHLVEAQSGRTQVFASFGDVGRVCNQFAVSSDGSTVIAPGTYGVVCWRRQADGNWKEAWSLDYWKEFPRLDWPVSNKAERIPQFHACIPRGGDHALIVFGEFTNQGWVTPDNPCSAWLAAVDLRDGKERWRFDVPTLKTLLFPTLHTSPDGSRLLLQVQQGSWNKETFRFYSISKGKAVASWDSRVAPMSVAVADGTGRVALVFRRRLLEVREPDGTLAHNTSWKSQPVSLAFAEDGRAVYVADDAGLLTRLNGKGGKAWQAELGCVASLAASGKRVYAARWDGRLQSFASDGKLRWTLDCTPACNAADPMATAAASAKLDPKSIARATRPATTSSRVPTGDNLLRTGKATLKLGGTPGWMSNGKLLVKADALTNGKTDDVATPWLHLDEVFWDATAGRQVWAEIALKQPTDVQALTVHENPAFPDSWPTEGLVQAWDPTLKRWRTAAFGVFLTGPINTYALNLKGATRLRYVPWNSYYRNFHTSEIEVR